jgi:hypothetical protein
MAGNLRHDPRALVLHCARCPRREICEHENQRSRRFVTPLLPHLILTDICGDSDPNGGHTLLPLRDHIPLRGAGGGE